MAIIRGTRNSDTLAGLSAADQITGLDGNDRLSGNGGNDTLTGGRGNDRLTGGSGHDRLNGDAGNDILNGDTGNDILNGSTGTDSMRGGAGNDTYHVNSSSDIVSEQTNTDANDRIVATISIDLADYVEIEHVTLQGTANLGITGDLSDNSLVGNSGGNTIIGDFGSDTLSGGAGDDLLSGGFGNDTLYGGAGNDALMGGNADDFLDGGSGTDQMYGGAGNDTYVVDNINDRVYDSGGMVDSIVSSVTVALYSTAFGDDQVENLTLTGNTDIDGFGSSSNNVIVGNSGANTLEGYGGSDTLRGAGGSDKFYDGSSLAEDAGDQGDEYLYLTGDLNGGAIDVIFGFLDDGAVNATSDHIDVSDLIDVVVLADLQNAIYWEDDGQGGRVYSIDIDGNLNGLGTVVPFLHLADDATGTIFEADGRFWEFT